MDDKSGSLAGLLKDESGSSEAEETADSTDSDDPAPLSGCKGGSTNPERSAYAFAEGEAGADVSDRAVKCLSRVVERPPFCSTEPDSGADV